MPTERDRLDELTRELERLDRLINVPPRGLDKADRANQFKELLHKRVVASLELDEFQAKLAGVHGALEGKVAELSEIQAALPAKSALITWVDILPLGPNDKDLDGEHWGVVVRSRGVPIWISIEGTGPHELWSQDDIELANQVRTGLQKGLEGGAADLDRRIERLRAQRLEPLAKVLGATDDLPKAERLIVLPSRAMAGIPLEALLAKDDTRTVSYAPSATVFKYLRERPMPDRKAGLLALGDPVFRRPEKANDPEPPDHGLLVNGVVPGFNAARCGLKPGDVLLSYNGTALRKLEDLKSVPEPGRPVPVELWRGGKFNRLELAAGKLGVVFAPNPAPQAIVEGLKLRQVLAAAQAGDGFFPPLRHAREEIEEIDRLFRTDNWLTQKFLDSAASEPNLDGLAASGKLGRFGVIHLATHAVIDEGIPARSAVMLSQVALPDSLEQALLHKPGFDGRVSVREIQRGWKLKADLVTLSACETALGREVGGEGFVGFTQALLISGEERLPVALEGR